MPGLLARAVNKAIEQRANKVTLGHPSERDALRGLFAGPESASGRTVGVGDALSSSAVWAAVRYLSSVLSTLPLEVYRDLPGRGRERATDMALYRALHDQPNPLMTSVEIREATLFSLLLRGNAFWEIDAQNDGGLHLWPLRTSWMEFVPDPRSRSIRYLYTVPGMGPRSLLGHQLVHFRGPSPDGLLGYQPVSLHRETISQDLDAREYAGRFFGNDSTPRGYLATDSTLSDEAQKRLKAAWESAHRGLENAHRIAVFEEGIKFHAMGVSPEDAQLLDTRKFSVAEVARVFGVQPHKIGDLSNATFSNIEHQAIESVTDVLAPWAKRLEQRLEASLVTVPGISIEHQLQGLLRGDSTARREFYASAIQNGWMTVNEARALENLNPVDGGDTHYIQSNLAPLVQEETANDESMQEGVQLQIQRLALNIQRLEAIGDTEGAEALKKRLKDLIRQMEGIAA